MPTPCDSGYSIDRSASLEPSLPFASLLAPVLAADGPGSSHPPASPNGVVLPLVRMISSLSHRSIQPLFLALPWTDFGDPALEGWPSPRSSPSSSPHFSCPAAQAWPSPSFLTGALGARGETLPTSVGSSRSQAFESDGPFTQQGGAG